MIQKFYFPLTVHTYERDDWGIDWDNSIEGDGRTAIRYRGDIENTFERYNDGDDMARYFSRSETVKAKIQHCEWRFENFDGCLYGRVDVILSAPLTEAEIEIVKEWISGQNSDGLGEGFEQQDIRTKNGDVIMVSFWNPSDDYRIMTEDEFKGRAELDL